MTGRGPGGGRGPSSSRGDRGAGRGDRGGGSFRGGRGDSSSRGARGGGQFRGGRGDNPSRGDRGGARGDGRGRGRGSAQEPEAYGADSPIIPPAGQVQETEDAIQASRSAPRADILVDLEELELDDRSAGRPGYGTKGTPVAVWANHFRLTGFGSARLYRYHIKIDPEPATIKRKGHLIKQLITEGHVSRLAPGLASDFRMLLFANEELIAEDIVEDIAYKTEEEDAPRPNARVYRLKLQHNATLDTSELRNYIWSRDERATLRQLGDFLQALNIIIDHHAKYQPNDMTLSIGSNKHYNLQGRGSEYYDLGGGLTAWRGFFTSIRNGPSRLTLNLQIKHAPVYDEGPLPVVIDAFRYVNGNDFARLESFLKSVIVETDHLPERRNSQGILIPRFKSILGLASPNQGSGLENPPRISRYGARPDEVEFFRLDNPTQGPSGGEGGESSETDTQTGYYVTVFEHFRINYNRQTSLGYPVVNVGTLQKPSYLPADVCYVRAGQPARKKLDADQTRHMLNFAVRNPRMNASSIVESGTAVVGTNPQNPTLAQFGISFTANLITVPARILKGPNVIYRDNTVAPTRFGSWNMNQIRFTSGTQLQHWSYVLVNDGTPMSLNEVNITVREFKNELGRMGVASEIPLGSPGFTIDFSKGMTIEGGFRRAASVRNRPTLLLFILPRVDTNIYQNIKFLGDVKYGIHTVCVVYSKFTKKRGPTYDLQYFANVALKFNLKLGGANQRLDQSKLGIIGEGKTMLVGIDVTHPTRESSSSSKSVSGMVASINSSCSQFPATLRFQAQWEDIVTELKDMLSSRIRLWQKHNQNALPENILVYRDGISEGQFDKVIRTEIPSMKEACAEIYPGSWTKEGFPKLTVLICGKRHNTRFYPSTTQAGKIDVRSSNNPNGTVVDRGVTDPRIWDFYLQAHTAIQGTARPAHYYVIHDEIFDTYRLSALDQAEECRNKHDVLETLTHNLSYLYGRATKAVSICPPAYYADLVCERSRCYLADFFDPENSAEDPEMVFDEDGNPVPNSDNIEIHENLRDTMFYI